jgi:Ca2+-binding EF-hand superfamily protein
MIKKECVAMNDVAKKTKLHVAVMVVLSSVSVVLNAQEIPQKEPISFSLYDTNKNGFISKGEFNNAKNFSFFDVNKDGKISKLELQEGQRREMLRNKANIDNKQRAMIFDKPAFESFDLNGDGHLNSDEMIKARAYREKEIASQGKIAKDYCDQTPFSQIDLNGDGIVTKEEFISNQMRQKK